MTFNAKAETVQSSATWRGPFERRRCLVPADGFYEWKKLDPKTKQPFAFGLKDAAPFTFASLWDAWKDPASGEWLQSFAIITTDPNEVTAEVRNLTDRSQRSQHFVGILTMDIFRALSQDVRCHAQCISF